MNKRLHHRADVVLVPARLVWGGYLRRAMGVAMGASNGTRDLQTLSFITRIRSSAVCGSCSPVVVETICLLGGRVQRTMVYTRFDSACVDSRAVRGHVTLIDREQRPGCTWNGF